jgi:HepT-like protein
MSRKEFSGLTKRIRQELDEIQIVLSRVHDGWNNARRSNDDLYLDSVALNLHGFYSGFERIFTHIAETVDDDLPRGENWHELLLLQMMREVPKIRPAVISIETGRRLDELRRFRHVVRNVYTHKFNPENIEKLIGYASDGFERLRAELSAFADFLEQA